MTGRARRGARPNDEAAWKRLVATASVADPDETRNRLRRLWSQPDRKAQREPLLKLAEEADPRSWPPVSLTRLAKALGDAGERGAAALLLRRAGAEHPGDVWVNYNLAQLLEQLRPPQAEEAIRLDPDDSGTHVDLGKVLFDLGKLDQAIAACRQAIRLKPDAPLAHCVLGGALEAQRRLAEANAAYHESIRLKPDFAEAHCNLAGVLTQQGQLHDALAEYRRSHELGSKRPGWAYPSADWVRDAERLVALESRLPAVLGRGEKPRDALDGIEFALLAYKMKRFGASARLYAESFRTDPKLAEDTQAENRYTAARAAALVGAAKGNDRPPLDEPNKARWRKQALEWLRADLAFWIKQAGTGKREAKALVGQTLKHWKVDSDLAGIRDETALQALPEDERRAFRALWAEVDRVAAKAQAGAASDPR